MENTRICSCAHLHGFSTDMHERVCSNNFYRSNEMTFSVYVSAKPIIFKTGHPFTFYMSEHMVNTCTDMASTAILSFPSNCCEG